MLSLYIYPTTAEKIFGWINKVRFKIEDGYQIEIPIILNLFWIGLLIYR
jgi:hypothetical protein